MIGKIFGISESTVKQIIKRFNLKTGRHVGPSQSYIEAQRAKKTEKSANGNV